MEFASSVIFFPCKDLRETVAYYTEVLELSLYKDQGNAVWLDTGYGYLGFVQYADGRPMPSGNCLSFNMPSRAAVDALYERLLTRPVIGLKGAPAPHPNFPVYSFFLSDPNGYLLEIQHPND